ncbi:MAG: hypothetical protein GEV12_03675 [Micromonosporaceae bacterium]|nr:hypothetical protein [Micromonosporaceae bacterium]
MRRTQAPLIIGALLLLLLGAPVAGAAVGGPADWRGEPSALRHSAGFAWERTFFGPGLDDNVLAATVWDDGSGPALYVGGLFLTAGDEVVNRIARWDGTDWSPLTGPSGTGVDAQVHSLAVHDGDLIVGGSFLTAGGVPANRIARWDGQEWSPLGSGMDRSQVRALTTHQGDLYAAGAFTEAGGVPANRVARWDGQQWSPLGPGVDSGTVFALAEFGGDLVAAGNFRQVGGVGMNRIARWDGQQWSPLGNGLLGGLTASVNALAQLDGELVAAGSFPQAGAEVIVNNVARWDGTDWSPLGTGVSGTVHALAVHQGELFAGGAFTQAGGVPVDRVARWDGTGWAPLAGPSGTGVDGNSVRALAGFAGELVVAGAFQQAGGLLVNRVARWDGTGWAPLAGSTGPGTGLAGEVHALAAYQGDLIVGGEFRHAGGLRVNHLARWDGTGWSPLGSPAAGPVGVDDVVWSLAVHDGDLIVGGQFTHAGDGLVVNNVARWDGTGWSALAGPAGTGVNASVRALASFQGALVAGGQFTEAGGAPASRVASWDGAGWAPLGAGVGGISAIPVQAIVEYEGLLVVAGTFPEAGGQPMSNVAGWDGQAWSPLAGPAGAGTDNRVQALAVHGGELVAGGGFTEAGGVAARWLARWDGTGWSAFDAELAGGCCSPWVRSLLSTPDGLVAGGVFTEADGGVVVNHIARWDGAAWSPLAGPAGTGVGGGIRPDGGAAATSVWALASWAPDGAPDGAVAGGSFAEAGGVPDWGLARYAPVRVPAIVVTPGSLPIEQAPDEVTERPVTIANAGDGALDWRVAEAAESCQSPADLPWLGAAPDEGQTAPGASTEVTVTVDTTDVAPGGYSARLCVSSNDPSTPLVEVPVSLTVTEPPPGGCDATITGVHPGPVTVTDGVTCLAAGAQVLGEFNVLAGAGLVATAAVIQGPLTAIGAASITVTFSQVTGPVLVTSGSGPISLFGSQVTGSVSLVGNVTGETPAAVSGNTIIGSLSCVGNQPPPTDHGLPNTATGGTFGQCAGM